ncbi:heme ABC transporter substrate-binding protein IsdE [Vallitalea longa]|uniref:Heme ABC transporter substrate-binding protein IsdE n=1 Tax=Vallitalea longa TaxID=2936439 RepID=A0A9W5Y704_9FIRM|nr:ABC transporter substrate-binding protein [Vallitalea longa]GKX27535.1 heme ABC transporter substrate-binding protein IsdE [Vallitalea longa]
MKNIGIVGLLVLVLILGVGCSSNKKAVTEKDVSTNTNVKEDIDNNQKEDNKNIEQHGDEKIDDMTSASKTEEKNSVLEFDEIPNKVAVGTIGLVEVFDVLGIDLVGVPSSDSNIPERYKDLPSIGMSMQPDMEKLKSLELDVFITDSALKNSLQESLENKKIRTEFIQTSGYNDIINSIETIGKAFDKEDEAKGIVDKMNNTEKEVMDKIEGKEVKKVMIIFGTPESFMLATDMSYIGDLANRLNLENITDDMEIKSPYVPFSIESVVSMNPDVILRFTHADPEVSRQMFEKEFSENPVWNALDAVKNEQVFDLDPEYFGVVANIRCSEALESLYDIIYGE